MEATNRDHFLIEVSLRLASRFYDSVQNNINPPVPNLGKPILAKKEDKMPKI